eukprot:6205570-Pleurochrysis_carterae.AAC.2
MCNCACTHERERECDHGSECHRVSICADVRARVCESATVCAVSVRVNMRVNIRKCARPCKNASTSTSAGGSERVRAVGTYEKLSLESTGA